MALQEVGGGGGGWLGPGEVGGVGGTFFIVVVVVCVVWSLHFEEDLRMGWDGMGWGRDGVIYDRLGL